MSLRGSYYWTTNGPYMRIDVGYTQTGRTSSSATYQVTMAVYFTSSGWHGYGLSANVNINGATQALRIKEPSTTWRGAGHKGTWTFTVTAPAGTGGGTLPASIAMWGTEGDNTNIQSGARTVTLSTWNTAPTWTSDDANVNGWKENKTIPENTGAVTVNLPSASDKEGNTIKYDVYRYVNGASNSKIATGITSRTVSDNISSFGQGSQIKYLIKCNDGSLWASGDRWTWTYTKNKFTPASISTSSSIGYNTTSISLNVSGASNTNGNTTFNYRLTNTSGLTIHNGDFTPASGKVTFSIYGGSGTRPSTPHIDLADLKSYTAKGIYQGTLVLRLTTSNAYGSSDYRDVSIPIDLRIAPVPATLANPTGAITVAGSSYFVFNRSTVGVSWSGATDKLGAGALSYELYYRYGSGSWNRLVSTSGTSWSGTLPQVTSATTCSFKVVATTTYGYSATSAEKSITMHYYNPPKVSYRSPNRTTSEFTVYIDSSTDTSITAVAISSRTFTGLAGTAKPFTGTSTLITDTGLNGESTYNVVVKVTDNSGLSNATTTINVPVATYIPIMSITNKGIAISTTADSDYKLNIGGSLSVTGTLRLIDPSNTCKSGGIFTYTGDANGMGIAIQSGGTMVVGSGESPKALMDTISSKGTGALHLTSDTSISFVTNCQTIANRVTATLNSSGTFNAPNVQVAGNNVYHTGRKPSASDVGAMADGGTYGTIYLNNWFRSNGNTGWYNQTHGGGWYMADSTWIRAFNSKALLLNNDFKLSYGTPNMVLDSTDNSAQGKGSRIRFNNADNQNVQIRHEWYDSPLQPFGLVIEKASDNTQNYNASLKVEGAIVCGVNTSEGNIDNSNKADARLVRGATDTAGSLKVQVGGTDTTAAFEIVNPNWSTAWFSCGNTGIRSSSYSNFSDKTLKTNIEESSKISDKISKIGVYTYNYLSDFDKENTTFNGQALLAENMPEKRWGVIAQEVEEIFPELIVESETLIEGENKKVKSVDVYGLTVLTLEYAKELQAENAELKARLTAIEEKLGLGTI